MDVTNEGHFDFKGVLRESIETKGDVLFEESAGMMYLTEDQERELQSLIEQIEEGLWDRVKGTAKIVGKNVKDKIAPGEEEIGRRRVEYMKDLESKLEKAKEKVEFIRGQQKVASSSKDPKYDNRPRKKSDGSMETPREVVARLKKTIKAKGGKVDDKDLQVNMSSGSPEADKMELQNAEKVVQKIEAAIERVKGAAAGKKPEKKGAGAFDKISSGAKKLFGAAKDIIDSGGQKKSSSGRGYGWEAGYPPGPGQVGRYITDFGTAITVDLSDVEGYDVEHSRKYVQLAAAGGHAGASAYRYGMTMYALSKGYKKGERGGDGDPDPGPGEIETGAGEADTGPVPIFKDLRTKDPETGKMRRVGAKEGGSSLQAVLQNWINKNGGGFDRKALQKAVRQIVQDISKQMKANKIEIQEAVKIFENRLNLLTEAEITKNEKNSKLFSGGNAAMKALEPGKVVKKKKSKVFYSMNQDGEVKLFTNKNEAGEFAKTKAEEEEEVVDSEEEAVQDATGSSSLENKLKAAILRLVKMKGKSEEKDALMDRAQDMAEEKFGLTGKKAIWKMREWWDEGFPGATDDGDQEKESESEENLASIQSAEKKKEIEKSDKEYEEAGGIYGKPDEPEAKGEPEEKEDTPLTRNRKRQTDQALNQKLTMNFLKGLVKSTGIKFEPTAMRAAIDRVMEMAVGPSVKINEAADTPSVIRWEDLHKEMMNVPYAGDKEGKLSSSEAEKVANLVKDWLESEPTVTKHVNIKFEMPGDAGPDDEEEEEEEASLAQFGALERLKEIYKQLDLDTPEGRKGKLEDDQSYLGAFQFYKVLEKFLKAVKAQKWADLSKIVKKGEVFLQEGETHWDIQTGAPMSAEAQKIVQDGINWVQEQIKFLKIAGLTDSKRAIKASKAARGAKDMDASRPRKKSDGSMETPGEVVARIKKSIQTRDGKATKNDLQKAMQLAKAGSDEASRQTGQSGVINTKQIIAPRLKAAGISIDKNTPQGKKGLKFVKNLQKVIRRFIARHLKRLGKADIKQITEKLEIKIMAEILSSNIDFSNKAIISESIDNLVIKNLKNEIRILNENKK